MIEVDIKLCFGQVDENGGELARPVMVGQAKSPTLGRSPVARGVVSSHTARGLLQLLDDHTIPGTSPQVEKAPHQAIHQICSLDRKTMGVESINCLRIQDSSVNIAHAFLSLGIASLNPSLRLS